MSASTQVVARTTLVLVGALVLQLGLVDDLRVFSVHPELVLAVAIGTAVAWGAERGAIVGFAAGLLTDLFLSGRFGVTGLAYGVTGYGVGVLADGIARRGAMIDAALVALGSAAGVLLYAVVAALLGQQTLTDPHLGRIIGMVALYGALLSPLVLPVCRWTGQDEARLRHSR